MILKVSRLPVNLGQHLRHVTWVLVEVNEAGGPADLASAQVSGPALVKVVGGGLRSNLQLLYPFCGAAFDVALVQQAWASQLFGDRQEIQCESLVRHLCKEENDNPMTVQAKSTR